MARILITGSSDGIGAVAANKLIQQGHSVILHARNETRATAAKAACPGAEDCLIGDLSNLSDTQKLAPEANSKYGALDAVVHNAGVGASVGARRTSTGASAIFFVNSLAPFVLASLMLPPKRLVFVSSGLHMGGDESLRDVAWQERKTIDPSRAYADSKLHNAIFSAAVARLWTGTQSFSLDPGWVPTKLGSYGAPGDIQKSGDAIAWLAAQGGESGKHYSSSSREKQAHRAVTNTSKQDQLIAVYEEMSGVKFPKQ